MTTKTKTKKEVYPVRYSEESNGVNWRCKKCGDEHEFYACPVVPPEADTIGVRLIGNEANREEVRKERKT